MTESDCTINFLFSIIQWGMFIFTYIQFLLRFLLNCFDVRFFNSLQIINSPISPEDIFLYKGIDRHPILHLNEVLRVIFESKKRKIIAFSSFLKIAFWTPSDFSSKFPAKKIFFGWNGAYFTLTKVYKNKKSSTITRKERF